MDTSKPRKFHYAWWIMISCAMVMLAVLGSTSQSEYLFFPYIMEDLGISNAGLNLSTTLTTIVMCVCQPLARKLFDTCSIKLVTTLSVILAVGAFMLQGTFNGIAGFLAVGCVFGVAHSFVTYTLAPLVCPKWFKSHLGFAIGFVTCAMYIGGAIFCSLAGVVLAQYTWRMAFVVIGVVALVLALPFTLFVIKNKPEDIGLERLGEHDEVMKDAKGDYDEVGLTTKNFYKSPGFWLSVLYVIVMQLGVVYLVENAVMSAEFGYTATQVSMAATCTQIGAILGCLVLGSLRDKWGTAPAMGIGFALGLAAQIFFTVNLHRGVTPAFGIYAAFMVIWGVTMSVLIYSSSLVVRAGVGNRSYNVLYSYIASINTAASAIGIVLFGKFYDMTGSNAFGTTFSAVFIAVTLVVLFATCAFGKKHWGRL